MKTYQITQSLAAASLAGLFVLGPSATFAADAAMDKAAPRTTTATTTKTTTTSAHSHGTQHARGSKKGYTRAAVKKGGSGIGFQYKLLGKPSVGQALRIAIMFDGVTAASGAKASMTADSGLSMGGGGQEKSLARSVGKQAQQSNSQEISVTPQAEGLFYVNVFTEQGGRSAAAAIPIRVGDKPLALPTTGEVKTDATGSAVISMPAK
jgi:hypothetical protein